MSDLRIKTIVAPGESGNDGWVAARGDKLGNLYSLPAELGFGVDGRLFGCHFGTVTTPLATAATTAIAAQRPMAWLRIPDGTAIMPLSVNILVEAAGATTQGEISIAICQNDVGNGTSSAGTSGALSLNTAVPRASLVTPRQLSTGDSTAETSLLELKRFSFAASAVNQDFSWNARQLVVPLVLRGPASFLVYIGGNAVNFYAQMQWLEVTETSVSA